MRVIPFYVLGGREREPEVTVVTLAAPTLQRESRGAVGTIRGPTPGPIRAVDRNHVLPVCYTLRAAPLESATHTTRAAVGLTRTFGSDRPAPTSEE